MCIKVQLLKHIERHCPKSYDELYHMIENYKGYYIDESGYNGVLNDLSDSQIKNSSNLWLMASDIVKTLKATHKKVSVGIPINILNNTTEYCPIMIAMISSFDIIYCLSCSLDIPSKSVSLL